MVAWTSKNGDVAIVSAVRTPMARMHTALADVHVTDLARVALGEALLRAGWPETRVDEVILGNVVMPADATNPARVAALKAGLPQTTPAVTVQRNCASGLESISEGARRIIDGRARAVLAGGAESMSTIPLLFPKSAMGPMTRLARARSIWRKLAAIAALRPRHFKPVAGLELGLTDPICNMIMGQTGEVLAHEFGITREQADEFALRSHQRATEAAGAGRFDDQLVPVYAGDRFTPVTGDIGPRPGQTMEALAKLKPIFDRRDGRITVGNACQVTDGAAATLLLDGDMARAEGLSAIGHVRGYATAALDPARMGLGPVFAIDALLAAARLTLKDIELFEINEAFAAQVLACLKASASDGFAQRKLGRSKALGEIDPNLLNISGGAIALGHPVGATGTRLVVSLLSDMKRLGLHRGIAALCVGGGQGAAMLIERED